MSARSFFLCVVAAAVGVWGSTAFGQTVPPAPAKTPATPEYKPPPPPAPPVAANPNTPTTGETKPAPPEEPLPSLIELDENGKIKPLKCSAEEAAVRALKLDEETMKKVEASLSARQDELVRFAAEKIDVLTDVRKAMATVNEGASIDEMTNVTRRTQSFVGYTKVLDRLSKDGAIDPQTKSRAARVVREYQNKWSEQLRGNKSTNEIMPIAFKNHLEMTTGEASALVDRQLEAGLPRATELLKKVEMPAEMRAAVDERLRKNTGDAKAKLEGLRGIFYDTLGTDQQRAFLKAISPKLYEEKKDAAAPPTPPPASPEAPKK